MINNIKARFVKFCRQRLLRNRHPHRISYALPQRAGGGFNTRRITIFWMTRRAGVELTKVANIIHRQVIACKMQQSVNQHGAMTVRLNIAVAVKPLRIFWVMAKVMAPDNLGNISHTHRGARVARVGFLNRVDAQNSNGIR